MSSPFDLLSDRLIYAIGWTLVHSIWQGILIGLVLAGFLVIFKEQTPKFKYNISLLLLFIFFAFSTTTFFHLYQQYHYHFNNTISPTVLTTTLSTHTTPGSSIITHSQMVSYYLDILHRHMPFIVLFWGLGVLVLTIRFTGGLCYAQRLKHYQTTDITHIWNQRLNKLGEKIHLKISFRLFESAKIQIPIVIGFFKPVILLPAGALTGLPAAQIDAILAHELAHIYRRDFIINIFQSVINVIYFFHPVVWWMSSTIRNERENCCDDIALAITGDKLTLARALTTIYEHNIKVPYMAMAAMNNKFHLFKRIKRLTHTRSLDMNPLNGFFTACLLLIGILIIFVNASAHLKIDRKDLNKKYAVLATHNENVTLTDAGYLNDESRNLFAQNSQSNETRNNPESVTPVLSKDSVKSSAKSESLDNMQNKNNEKDEDFTFSLPMPVFDFSFLDSISTPIIDIDEEQIIQSLKIAETVLSNFDSSFFAQFNFQFDSLAIPQLDSIFTVHIDTNSFKDIFSGMENFDFQFDTTNFNKAMQRLQNLQINIDSIALHNLEQLEFNFDSTKYMEAFEKLENLHIELDTAKLAQIEKELENIHIEIDTLKLQKTLEKLEKERIKLDKVHSEIMEKMEMNREKIEKELAKKMEELDMAARELEELHREKVELEVEKRHNELEKQHQAIEKAHESENQD